MAKKSTTPLEELADQIAAALLDHERSGRSPLVWSTASFPLGASGTWHPLAYVTELDDGTRIWVSRWYSNQYVVGLVAETASGDEVVRSTTRTASGGVADLFQHLDGTVPVQMKVRGQSLVAMIQQLGRPGAEGRGVD